MRYISILISLCFLVRPAEASSINDTQVVRQISAGEMKRFLSENPGIKTKTILTAQTSAGSDSRNKEDEARKKKEETTQDPSPDVIDGVDAAVHLGSGSDEAALILFAVIGLVTVIAWVPYFPVLAYQAIKGDKKNIKTHHLLNVQWNPIIGSFNSVDHYSDKQSPRNGSLLGLRYSFITEKTNEDDYLKLGLAAESGHYLTKEKNLGNGDLIRKEGAYWLLGPSMIMGDLEEGSLYGKLDLMAGTSFDSDLGLISRAELSGNWLFHSGFTMGVSIGGLYLRVKEDRGIVSSSNDLGFIIGANAGFAF